MDELENGAGLPDAEGTAAPEKLSITDEMAQVYDRLEAEEKAPGEAAPETEAAPAADRARGPDGKFIAKTGTETPAAPAKAEAAPKQIDGQPKDQQQTAAPASAPSGPPESWSSANKAQWSQLPAWAQAEVSKRETDFAAYRQKSEQATQELTGYRQVLAPLQSEISRHGVTPARAVQHLVQTWTYAKAQPEAYVLEAIRELQIDPARIVQALTGGTQAAMPQGDPTLAALERKFDGFQQHIEQQTRQAQAQAEHQIASHIDQFAQQKDEQGNPLRPHFEAVRGIMSGLMLSGQAADLQGAYDMAVRANPTTWKQIQESEVKAAEAKRIEDAKTRAATAARISRTNVATKGVTGASPSRAAKTRAEEMEEVYDRMQGAA